MAMPHEVSHGHIHGKLCRLLIEVKGSKWNGHNEPETPFVWEEGKVVKVVMVSRFGDCGITDDLDAEFGYHTRVAPEKLEEI